MAVSVSALAVLGVRRRIPEMHIYRPRFGTTSVTYIVDSRHIEDPSGMANGEASLLLSGTLPLVLRRGSGTSRAAL